MRSRCQSIRFVPLPGDFVRRHLDKAGVEPVEAQYWADFTAGQLGSALQFSEMGLYQAKCQLIEQLAGLTAQTVLEYAASITAWAKGYAVSYLKAHPGRSQTQATRLGYECIGQMIAHAFHHALRISADPNQAWTCPDQTAAISSLARRYDPWACSQAIRATWRAQTTLAHNVNPTLIFEALMLNYLDYAHSVAKMGITD